MEFTKWVSPICAVISVCATFFTIWWPWHTRELPMFTQRRTYPPELQDNRLAKLIVACDNRRPFLFVEWRNDGDGRAHAVTVKPVGKDLDVRLMIENPDEEYGFQMVDDVALLAPGQSFVTVVLPNLKTDPERLNVILEYREEPTRLASCHVSKRMTLPYRLQGRRPLDIQERRVTWEYLRTLCEVTGHGFTDDEFYYWLKQSFVNWEDVDPAFANNPRSV